MIKSNTVFIIGAGASKEIGFPVGTELKHTISSKLKFKPDGSSGDQEIFNYLNYRQEGNISQYMTACEQISDGIVYSESIDDFIDLHQEQAITTCGKLAIAKSILEAERQSKLYNDSLYNSIDINLISDSWYPRFYSLLTKELRKPNIEVIFDNVAVINFNYDRSLEYFLVCALTKNILLDTADARSLVSQLRIYRPYGSVGPLFGSDPVRYGDTKGLNISNLKTYTEQIEDSIMMKSIGEEMQRAKTMIFLGNHYHPNNMKLLRSDAGTGKGIYGVKIYGTRFNITDHDLPVVCRSIGSLQPVKDIMTMHEIPPNMKFVPTCRDVFDTFQKSLAAL